MMPPRSRPADSRRRPPTAAETTHARAERRARAIEEPLDVAPARGLPVRAVEVRNPVRRTRYVVVLPGYPARDGAMCTCPDFARRGIGTCKHLESAFLWLADHPDALPFEDPGPLPGTWKAIERRLAELPRSRAPDAVRFRRPGAVLFDGDTPSARRSSRSTSD